jgi:hypothetical protein
MRKFLIIASGTIFVLFAAGSLFLHFNPLCGEELILEKTSPDGHYVAVLMSRNCGATTPYVAHINLRRATAKFHSDFFSGTVKDGEVYGTSKYSGDRFCCSGPRRLEIGYSDSDGRYVVRTWHDVTIGNDFRNPECE